MRTHWKRRYGLLIAMALSFVMAACAADQKNTTATAATADGDMPRIENFRFTPDEFTRGSGVQLVFDYRNIRGGLSAARVSLDYKGSLPGHSRKPSNWRKVITGDIRENGTFRRTINIKPSDSPSFSIRYYLRITDADGRKSNWATASVRYK